MTKRLLIFGLGYTGARLKTRMKTEGWIVIGTGRLARDGVLALENPEVEREIGRASHILSSVPPGADGDRILAQYGKELAHGHAWLGYLSSTGVYGDTGGAWVDETAPIGAGRRKARSQADAAWQALHADAHIFRLPGIYGPGRSPFAQLRAGTAQRIDAPGQVFSRIHVDDIVETLRRALLHPRPGIYNLADDEPAPAEAVTRHAAHLLGIEPPPLTPLAKADLSAAARGFYTENRRVANGRMKRELGIRLAYPDYRAGLAACLKEEETA